MWHRPPSPWGNGQEEAGTRREAGPHLPLPAGRGPGRGGRALSELGGLVRSPAACSLCGLRVPGTARHVLGGRRQLRWQGLGGGAGGEEAAETLLRLSRNQEGAGRLVGTRPRAPSGSPSSLGLSPCALPRRDSFPTRLLLPSRSLCSCQRAPGILGALPTPDGGCRSMRGRRESVEKETVLKGQFRNEEVKTS